MPNTLNAAALRLNEASEQCRLTAYLDPKGVPTIGWGHTGDDVHIGLTWTQAHADAMHQVDLAWAEQLVQFHATMPLTDNEYGALVDFAFNVGAGNFAKSGVLRAVNAGRRDLVPGQLMLWVFAGGKRMPGLVARRTMEARLWSTPDAATPPVAVLPVPAPAPSVTPDVPSALARVGAWLAGAGRIPQTAGATPMKITVLFVGCLMLSACQHVDPSDCRNHDYVNYQTSTNLTQAEKDEFQKTAYEVNFMSGWACGFRDGVNSRKLVIDLP